MDSQFAVDLRLTLFLLPNLPLELSQLGLFPVHTVPLCQPLATVAKSAVQFASFLLEAFYLLVRLSFGGVIHNALELWYRNSPDADRLQQAYDFIDSEFPQRMGDPQQSANWQLALAMFGGYVHRYAVEEFEVVEVEKEFLGEIRNPDTGRASQTFRIAGKADAIVQCHDGMYLLEHKTAASVDANYLDKLWTDTQIALYSHYLREQG